MKTLFTLAVVLITAQAATAQMMNENEFYNNARAMNGTLVLRSASIVKDYVVTVNGRYTYLVSNNRNDVQVNGIGLGTHYVEVSRVTRNIWGQDRKQVLYSGNVNVRRGAETTVNIDAFERVSINERQVYFDNGGSYGNGRYDDDDDRGCGNNRHRGRGKKYGHHKQDRNDRRYYDDDRRGNNSYYGWNN